jgi:hypothetical protein
MPKRLQICYNERILVNSHRGLASLPNNIKFVIAEGDCTSQYYMYIHVPTRNRPEGPENAAAD